VKNIYELSHAIDALNHRNIKFNSTRSPHSLNRNYIIGKPSIVTS
jgi:hypothetical protein